MLSDSFFFWPLALLIPFSCALNKCKWPSKENLLVDLVEGDKEATISCRRDLALEEVSISSARDNSDGESSGVGGDGISVASICGQRVLRMGWG